MWLARNSTFIKRAFSEASNEARMNPSKLSTINTPELELPELELLFTNRSLPLALSRRDIESPDFGQPESIASSNERFCSNPRLFCHQEFSHMRSILGLPLQNRWTQVFVTWKGIEQGTQTTQQVLDS